MSSSVDNRLMHDTAPVPDPFGDGSPENRVSWRHILTGVAVRSGGASLRFLTFLVRAFWYVALAIYSLPVLINLRALWRYQTTGKLVIRSYDSFMYTWIVVTAAPLLTLLAWMGAHTLFLGYLYLAFVAYSFYTAGRDVTWRRGWVVFAFALAILAVVWALGEHMEYSFFVKIKEALADTGLYFPAAWANALSIVLGILYLQMVIERHVSGTLTFEGDKLIVREFGESSSDHERSAYSIVARTDDVNEFILGFSRSLILRPRSSKDPEYVFRHVPGLPYLMPTILALAIYTPGGRLPDDDDQLGAGDGHAEDDGGHHN